MWAAIELGSGEYGTGVPKNSPARVLDLAADTFRGDAGQAQRLVRHASFSELLLIRPSNGIWTLTAGDGAVGDSDGAADGRMTNDLRTFQAFEESPPPPNRLEHGDLVFVVDPYALQLSVATFEPGR